MPADLRPKAEDNDGLHGHQEPTRPSQTVRLADGVGAPGLLEQPVFLLGMPRSGTTVLADILARHTDLFWLSNYQNRFPSQPLISVVNRLNNSDFFGVQLGKMRNKPKGFRKISKFAPAQSEAHYIWSHYCGPRFPNHYLFGESANAKTRNAFRSFLCSVGKAQGKCRFLHKFTGPGRIGYLQSIFPDAIFVNLIRDPRAVVASLFNSSFWLKGGGTERLWWEGSGITADALVPWEGTALLPVALAALQWERVLANVIEEADRHLEPHQLINIRYEDFTTDPQSTIQDVLDATHLPRSSRVEDFVGQLNIRSNMNDKFQKTFKDRELATIAEITAPTAATFGYAF